MNRHARQLFYFGWGNFAPIFNPLAQAVQILAKYGGSLWVADPAYTFTGSDGTGVAGDGSDAGYVRDLCGNARPLFQSTTSFKPKLRRVAGRWAWVFDGVDDRLATVALPTANEETLIVASQMLNTTTAVQGIISKRSSSGGLMVRREVNLDTRGYAMAGTTLESALLDSSTNATAKRVYSVVAASGNKRYRRDGIQVNTTTGVYTSYSGILSIGAEIFSANAACNTFAAAYCPGAPSDAELLIIEKAMAQLGGITI